MNVVSLNIDAWPEPTRHKLWDLLTRTTNGSPVWNSLTQMIAHRVPGVAMRDALPDVLRWANAQHWAPSVQWSRLLHSLALDVCLSPSETQANTLQSVVELLPQCAQPVLIAKAGYDYLGGLMKNMSKKHKPAAYVSMGCMAEYVNPSMVDQWLSMDYARNLPIAYLQRFSGFDHVVQAMLRSTLSLDTQRRFIQYQQSPDMWQWHAREFAELIAPLSVAEKVALLPKDPQCGTRYHAPVLSQVFPDSAILVDAFPAVVDVERKDELIRILDTKERSVPPASLPVPELVLGIA